MADAAQALDRLGHPSAEGEAVADGAAAPVRGLSVAAEHVTAASKQGAAGDGRQDPRPAITRRLVLRATLRLIAEQGFEGTTIESIAERSGVSRSTIYRHWPDPTVLYLEAFDPQSEEAALPPPSGAFAPDLRAYIQHVADRLNDDVFAAALAAQVDKGRRDPAYRQAHLRYALTRNEYGMSLFLAGVQSGQLRADIDPELETDRILGFLVFQRLMKYKLIDEDLVEAVFGASLGRCAAQPTVTGRPASRHSG